MLEDLCLNPGTAKTKINRSIFSIVVEKGSYDLTEMSPNFPFNWLFHAQQIDMLVFLQPGCFSHVHVSHSLQTSLSVLLICFWAHGSAL